MTGLSFRDVLVVPLNVLFGMELSCLAFSLGGRVWAELVVVVVVLDGETDDAFEVVVCICIEVIVDESDCG